MNKIPYYALKPEKVTPKFLKEKGDVLVFCLKYFVWYWASNKDVYLKNIKCAENNNPLEFDKLLKERKKDSLGHIKLCINV